MNLLKIQEINAEKTWPIRHTVMWPEKPFDFVKLENDSEGFHFGGYVDEELICIVSLFIKNNKAQFRKLATKENQQGKGYATKLLHHVFEFAKNKNMNTIWCNARKNKTNFYHKFSMTETNKTYKKGGIEFVVLEKKL